MKKYYEETKKCKVEALRFSECREQAPEKGCYFHSEAPQFRTTSISTDSSNATILLTIDVEDWFQVENIRSYAPLKDWSTFELRVEPNVSRLLRILSDFKIQATFFVLGWIAERCPDMVREISNQGHEVASHGYMHRCNSELTVSELQNDLKKSKEILEKVTGKEVLGYRAPNFSITRTTEDLLPKVGYEYDSSFNNFNFYSRYGVLERNWKRLPDGRMRADNGLIELPISNLELAWLVMPWGGGAYFRLWPRFLFELGVGRILATTRYYLFYCHPWEFDPLQPRIKCIGWSKRFRHYTNLARTENRLRHFLHRFRNHTFLTCSAKGIGKSRRIED